MNPRLARLLVRLYPFSWRRRYGAEFVALLESGKGGLGTAANVCWSAIAERIVPTHELTIENHQGVLQFRSWCVRAPWAIFGLVPVLLLGGAYLIALFMLWSGWKMFLPGADTPFRPVYGLQNLYFQAARFLYFGSPVLIGWAVGVVAARQRATAIWPSIGLALLGFTAAMSQVHASRTEVPGLGHIRMGITLGTSVVAFRERLVHASVILTLTMLPYLVWRLVRTSYRVTPGSDGA